MTIILRCSVILLAFHVFFRSDALSQWSDDSTSNNPICVQPNDQETPVIVHDGSEGGIVIWTDRRSSPSNADIYAQRFSPDGTPLWEANGKAVRSQMYDQMLPNAIADSEGGAIVVWVDKTGDNGDILALRIDSLGDPVWLNHVIICNAPSTQLYPEIAPDGMGGAIIAWVDHRSGGGEIYAQRIDANGTRLWNIDGNPVCTADNLQTDPVMAGDGAQGVIIAWSDERSGGSDIYAQRLDASGNALWTPDGIGIAVLPEQQVLPSVITDGKGGAFIAWDDWRSSDQQIYMQRVRGDSVTLWGANGTFVSNIVGNQVGISLAGDSEGGAVVAYQDGRGNGIDIYAERIDSAGVSLWDTAGVLVADIEPNQTGLSLIPDGTGGFLVSWMDVRNSAGWDIYAQRLDSTGAALWRTDGMPITTAPSFQSAHQMLGDGNGGAFVVWQDIRNGLDQDIFAQRILATGNLPSQTTVNVNAGWNLLAVSRSAAVMDADSLFPEATAPVYAFGGASYEDSDTLIVGEGYWVKFGTPGIVTITGILVDSVTITVPSGNRWVLVGSPSIRMAVSSLRSDPPGAILEQSIKGFNGSGYVTPSEIEPGHAYWVYVTQPCTIIID